MSPSRTGVRFTLPVLFLLRPVLFITLAHGGARWHVWHYIGVVALIVCTFRVLTLQVVLRLCSNVLSIFVVVLICPNEDGGYSHEASPHKAFEM